MVKVVVETVQVIKRKYYVETEHPQWALDGIVMDELDWFSSEMMSEDIWGWKQVDEFPVVTETNSEHVNGAVMVYDNSNDSDSWKCEARWDLCSK